MRLDLQCDEPSEIAFAAFYADCVHEVLPVTNGCRATLVINLVRAGDILMRSALELHRISEALDHLVHHGAGNGVEA